MINKNILAKICIALFSAVVIIALICSCQKDEQVSQSDSELETRAGIRLPIFFASSCTTDNFLLQNISGYQNIQNVWNKTYVDSITLDRSQTALVNIAGVLCGIYRVRVYDADTIIYQNEMFAKNGPDIFTVIPQGQSLLTAYNHIEITRQDSTELYYDFNCGVIKRRHLYEVYKDDVQGFEFINSQLCASPWFRLNHAH